MESHWQSVLFVDLDHTILEGPFIHAAFGQACGELAVKTGHPVDKIRQMLVEDNIKRQHDPRVSAIEAMDWDDIARAVAQRLGTTLEVNICELVSLHAGPPFARVLEEADQVLLSLRNSHRAIVAATKGLRKYQMPVLEALQLLPCFDDILTPDDSNALKGERAFYGEWPESTRVQMIVGDSYLDDILAPHRFGFRTIWKPRNPGSVVREMAPFEDSYYPSKQQTETIEPDFQIKSLRELPEVVNFLEGQVFSAGALGKRATD